MILGSPDNITPTALGSSANLGEPAQDAVLLDHMKRALYFT